MVDRALNASEVYRIVYPPVELILDNVAKVDKNRTLIESLIHTEQLSEHHKDLKELKSKHQLALEDIHKTEDLIRGELTDADNLTEARINSNNLKKRELEKKVEFYNDEIANRLPMDLDSINLTTDQLMRMDADELFQNIRKLSIRRQKDIIRDLTKKLEGYQQQINRDRRILVVNTRAVKELDENRFNILKQTNTRGQPRFLYIIYGWLTTNKPFNEVFTDEAAKDVANAYIKDGVTSKGRKKIKSNISRKYGIENYMIEIINRLLLDEADKFVEKAKKEISELEDRDFEREDKDVTQRLNIIRQANNMSGFRLEDIKDQITRNKIDEWTKKVKDINDDIIKLNEENSKISTLISKYDTAENIKKELEGLTNKERIDIYNKIAEDDVLLKTRIEKANSLIKPKEHKILSFEEVEKYDSIAELMDGHQVLLLIYRSEPTFGHWVILVRNKFGLNFFDSYGRYIDDAAKSINPYFAKMTGQDKPHLLKLLSEHTMPVHYNDYQLQKYSPKIQTCGRWCGYYGNRLRRGESMSSINIEFRQYKGDKDKLIVELTDPYLT